MNFTECMESNPARLVILYQPQSNGDESFQWGVVGNIPVITLIGHIDGLQSDLNNREWIPEADHPQPALVIAYDPTDKTLRHYMDHTIPIEPLVGMLEIIKGLLTTSRMAQHMGANLTPVLGPDGKPVRR